MEKEKYIPSSEEVKKGEEMAAEIMNREKTEEMTEKMSKREKELSDETKETVKELNKYKYTPEEDCEWKSYYHGHEKVYNSKNRILHKVNEYGYLKSLAHTYEYEKGYVELARAIEHAAYEIKILMEKEIEKLVAGNKKFTGHNEFSMTVTTSTECGSGDYRERNTPVESIAEAIQVADNRESNRAGDYDNAYLIIKGEFRGAESDKILELPMKLWVS